MSALQAALAVFFTLTGALKLAGHPHMRKEFRRFGYPYALARLAGALELLGAGLLAGGLWLPQLAAAGSLLLLPVMLGATYTNFRHQPLAYGLGMLVIVALTGLPLWLHGAALARYVQ
jgi:uncharacterized membrane protein YphA (DoxX/SURF4 family)